MHRFYSILLLTIEEFLVFILKNTLDKVTAHRARFEEKHWDKIMNNDVEKICLNCHWYWAKRLQGNCGKSEGTDFTCKDFKELNQND